jgi:hypothetical protein
MRGSSCLEDEILFLATTDNSLDQNPEFGRVSRFEELALRGSIREMK